MASFFYLHLPKIMQDLFIRHKTIQNRFFIGKGARKENKKIKILLGGYVNFLNAQNLNCKSLSEFLDREKFKIYTWLFPFNYGIDFEPLEDIKYIKLHRPVRILSYIMYIRSFINVDIAYIPTGYNKIINLIAKLCNIKIFKTVEGLIDELNMNLQGWDESRKRKYLAHFKYFEPNLFAITNHIKETVLRRHNFKFADDILYLGVNADNFINPEKEIALLKNVIFIGNKPSVKNIEDVFYASSLFPDINFHIVGGNKLQNGTIEEFILNKNLDNVIYHGVLDHKKLSKLLQNIDLMYFPSRSEGFPKVHLETACAGVPTLCYGDYGASEWITSWKNGIIVDTKEEAAEALKELRENPEKLKELSKNAVELGKKFDWKVLVKKWEEVIEKIYYKT